MNTDIFTFGETMLRLVPPDALRLEQSRSLNISYGGAESNVAANLARLDKNAVWFSKLPNNPLGWQCAAEIRRHGVDTSTIRWVDDARMGLYFVEYGQQPRGIRVWYDRANSAACQITQDDLPLQVIQNARWIHLTGITVALSESCRQAARYVLDIGRESGATVSFDVNYRARMWPPGVAAQHLAPFCQAANLVFIALRDAITLFHTDENPDKALYELQDRFGGIIVMTLGANGALAYDGRQNYQADSLDASIVDRLGAGDAFASGVICRLLEAASLSDALRFGAAFAALALSIEGDIVYVNRADVEAVLAGSDGRLDR